jgi:hypothetical protein
MSLRQTRLGWHRGRLVEAIAPDDLIVNHSPTVDPTSPEEALLPLRPPGEQGEYLIHELSFIESPQDESYR